MPAPLLIAVIGAPGSGRTTLARLLAGAIVERTGLAAQAVDGRDEATWQALDAAVPTASVLVLDGTPLEALTADDGGPPPPLALQRQRRCGLSLLTALPTLPTARRAGAEVVDRALRALLLSHRLPWAVVGGPPGERLLQALDAISPRLRERPAPRPGLFTRLADREAETGGGWLCSDCDVPECEHRSLGLRRTQAPG